MSTALIFRTTTAPPEPNVNDVQAAFVSHLPRIQAHALYALRHIACRDTREDLVCEVVGLAWKHFVSLTARGKTPQEFIATLAMRCSQAVRAGRRVAGGNRTRDVLSPAARARHGIVLVLLDEFVPAPRTDPRRSAGEGVIAAALAVDPKARVPEQAAFRVDFPRWLFELRDRDRNILEALIGGDRPGEVAARFGVGPARISQLREAFFESWQAFHGET